MSSLRRIVAAGLPTAGLTVLTALAISGSPALAATSDQAARPAAAATPCDDADRGNCGYGAATETPESPGAAPATTTPARGKPGYGSPAPSTTAPGTTAPTPVASTDTVPPGVSNESETPATPAAAATTPGGGVSAGHALPVTGAPMGAVISLGALLVAAGGASVWYTRRRRTA